MLDNTAPSRRGPSCFLVGDEVQLKLGRKKTDVESTRPDSKKTKRRTFFCYKRVAHYEATHTKQSRACKECWEKKPLFPSNQLVRLHIVVFSVCGRVGCYRIQTTSGSLHIDSGLLQELYPLIEGELIDPKTYETTPGNKFVSTHRARFWPLASITPVALSVGLCQD